MKKTLGSMVVIDTNPARFTHSALPSAQGDSHAHLQPGPTPKKRLLKSRGHQVKPENYDHEKDNPATYLFFPMFAAFLLMLLATLSTPIIQGLNLALIDMGDQGKVAVGAWGWCTKDVPGYDNTCSENRNFGVSLKPDWTSLPDPVNSLSGMSEAIKPPYLIANAVMHIIATIISWATLTWTLAASGSWKSKERHAYEWTRWAFRGSGLSALFVLVAWALDLAMYTRIKENAITVDNTKPSVKPGAAIFMLLFAFLFSLGAFISRMTWGKYRPRPAWTIKGNSDFHNPSFPSGSAFASGLVARAGAGAGAGTGGVPIGAPHSAALPPSEDLPPSWSSLNMADAKEIVLLNEKPSISQPGFSV